MTVISPEVVEDTTEELLITGYVVIGVVATEAELDTGEVSTLVVEETTADVVTGEVSTLDVEPTTEEVTGEVPTL